MTRLQSDLQIPIKYVGTLVLMGTDDVESSNKQTTVYFGCWCSPNAPLARYFDHWAFDDKDFITDLVAKFVDDISYEVYLFTRTVKGRLEDSRQFLHATANRLLRELQHAEDIELSMDEVDDQKNWADNHIGRNCGHTMPDFKRPRHV